MCLNSALCANSATRKNDENGVNNVASNKTHLPDDIYLRLTHRDDTYMILMWYCIDHQSVDCVRLLLSFLSQNEINQLNCGERIYVPNVLNGRCEIARVNVLSHCLQNSALAQTSHCLLDSRIFTLDKNVLEQLDMSPNAHWKRLLKGREMCLSAVVTMYAVLRKRYRVKHNGFSGGYKLPKEICQIICEGVWDTRQETAKWLNGSNGSNVSDPDLEGYFILGSTSGTSSTK